MTTHWNPAQYNQFKDQRAKPFFDLLALIQPARFNYAVDLGCGTGELTRSLFDKLLPDNLIGIDSSMEMLTKAQTWITSGLSFEQLDIARYQPDMPLDLLFSNAALHWLPHHDLLFPKLLAWIAADGQVAIQMPYNFDHPSHTVAHTVAVELFPHKFKAEQHFSGTLAPEQYAAILHACGFEEQRCRMEVYGHSMPSGDAVVEWTRGSLLTAYQQQLSAQEFEHFVNAYRDVLVQRLGNGPYFYAFKRLLLWGRKRK
jgi:trans-aconitate 2-methyltransferase